MKKWQGLRFQVQLACHITPLNSFGVTEAVTLDVGRSGALVLMQDMGWIAAGDSLKLDLFLPVNRSFGPRCVSCQGVAVRAAEQNGGGFVLAICFHRVKFGKKTSAKAELSSVAVH